MLLNNNNQKAFFALLQAGLWAKPEKRLLFDSPVDWEEICRLACEQSVLGLVLAGIECLPNEIRPPKVMLLQWIGEIQMQEQQNKEMNAFIGGLVEKLRNAGIYTLLVKGQGIAQYYERPLWRSSGDVDLFLDADNYESAKAFLLPCATSTNEEDKKRKHIGLYIDSWLVELHGTLRCGLGKRIDRELDALIDESFKQNEVRIWQNGKTEVCLPSPDNDILFVFTHILQHFFRGGIGLRQICDWCRLLWVYRSVINIQQLEKHLRKMGLMAEWKAFGCFAVEYLGMPFEAMPLYAKEQKWSNKAMRIVSLILVLGNFGQGRDKSYKQNYPKLIANLISSYHYTKYGFLKFTLFPAEALCGWWSLMIAGTKAALKK